MPEQGPTFTDWAQLDADDHRRPMLIDEDFSWSEPPSRRRRSSVATVEREARVEPRYRDHYNEDARHVEEERYLQDDRYARQDGQSYVEPDPQEPYPYEEHEHAASLNVEHELDTAWGGRLSAPAGAQTYEVDPYDFEPPAGFIDGGRRTVVISGRGTSGYALAPRRRGSELSFHERASFNPDRTGMWALLLCIAVLIGCIAH